MPLGEFAKNKTRKDGLANWCKQCNKAYKATYCQANKKKIAEHRAEYYLTHREDELKKMAQYRQANREVLLQKQAEYYQANKDTILQKAAEYRANHKEAIAQKKAEYYNPQTHPLNWAKQMVKGYKRMDRERFGDDSKTITAEWFVQNIMYKPCAHCGLLQAGSIGVNRLDNSKPHIPSNCEPCCKPCNTREGVRDQIARGLAWFQKGKKQSFSSFVEEHKAKHKKDL